MLLVLSSLGLGSVSRAAGQNSSFPLNMDGWQWGGSLSLAYRNIGAAPIEIEIENQLLLSDIFFRGEGPVVEQTPFLLEFALDEDGRPELYRLAVKTLKIRRGEIEIGPFPLPFRRANQLYRPAL